MHEISAGRWNLGKVRGVRQLTPQMCRLGSRIFRRRVLLFFEDAAQSKGVPFRSKLPVQS